MAQKPTFKVKVSKSNWENNFPPSLATNTWSLAGSEAEGRLKAKSKQGGFNSSVVQKSRLCNWNLNTWDIGGEGTSDTTFAHVMPPTPQSPMDFDCSMVVLDEVLASNTVEREGWMGPKPLFPL